MPERIHTTGSRALDDEIDALYAKIRALEASIRALKGSAAAAPAQTVVQNAPASGALLTVGDVAGTVLVHAATLLFDGADGFQVAQSGSGARVDRTASTATPTATATAASAGTGTKAANEDHAHLQGIVTTKGDVLTYSSVPARLGVGTNGQFLSADSAQTTGLKWAWADVEVRNSDPGTPRTGQVWYRSDTDEFCIYTGAATKRSAAFT